MKNTFENIDEYILLFPEIEGKLKEIRKNHSCPRC